MPSTGLLTAGDRDEISRAAFDAAPPRQFAGPVADQVDAGYLLMRSAEIAERAGDLPAALVLAERAVEAHRVQGDPGARPRAFRAGLLLRLGRQDEAMAELTALRPSLSQDPVAVPRICEALEAGGFGETAEQWLTEALTTTLQRMPELTSPGWGPDHEHVLAAVFMLAVCRHEIRSHLGLPHDDYDHLGDRLMGALEGMLAADELDDGPATVLFWPQPEFDRLVLRWPALGEEYGKTWDEYRSTLQKTLALCSESSSAQLGLRAGSVEGLAAHAERTGGDPADPQLRQDYAEYLAESAGEIAWPPGRNHPCWCGSTQKYKKCCLPRARP